MIRSLIISLFVFSSLCAQAQDKVIRILKDPSDPNGDYAVTMLKLANSKIGNKYRIEEIYEEWSQGRVNEEVRVGGMLDLAWTTSDATLEDQVYPIRIPLYKGLLGYRIFIINKNNQHKFDNVTTLEDLKKFTFGQGRTWADAAILEANGFKLVKTTKYPNLFYMVEGERFDAFPRGVHEPFGELAQRPDMELAVEKNLMVAYKMPMYFFVSPKNPELGRDIENGLNAAIADGSFDKTFFGAQAVKDVIEKVNMKQRRVFYLENPTLHKDTPLDRAELWFDPKDLE
jgi:hypothetical protein